MLEQIKAMKYKKQYTYIAAGLAILAILYIFISDLWNGDEMVSTEN